MLFVLLISAQSAFAQSASSYSVSRSTGITYNSISSTGNSFASWLDYASTDDNRSAATDIGFTFSYMGNSYTQFSISTNGYLDFSSSTADGETAGPYGFDNSQFRSPSGTLLAIAPIYDDLIGKLSIDNSFKYLVSGSAPNRVLTVEWINVREYSDNTSDLNFQMKLYETTNVIEVVYGSMSADSSHFTYTVGINNSTMSGSPLPSELLTQQTANTGAFSNAPKDSLGSLPESNSMIRFVVPMQEKYYGGSFDGYDGNNSTPSNANGVSPNFAKFYGGSYDGYSLGSTPLSNLSGSTTTAAKYHGGNYDGFGVGATLLGNLNGTTATLSKYFGGNYDGYGMLATPLMDLSGATTTLSKYYGGNYDGYADVLTPRTSLGNGIVSDTKFYGGSYDGYGVFASMLGNLNGVTATLSKYHGGSYDGYGAYTTLLTDLTGSTTAVSKYYGGSFDGYADVLTPRTSLGNGIVQDAKFYGGSYDGFADALSFPLPMQITGAKYLGGGFDGVTSLQTLLTNFDGLTLLLAKYYGGAFDGFSFGTSVENGGLPIQLAEFTGQENPSGRGVLLEWMTISETNCYGFYLERRKDPEASFVEVPNSFTAGHQTTLEQQRYSFVDSTLVSPGKYYYRLRQVDLDGKAHYSPVIVINVTVTSVMERAPIEFRVYQNYPNPFNPTTTITFTVEKEGPARVIVYNILGQEVARLFDGNAQPGMYYRFTMHGDNIGSGVYFYRITTEHHSELKKMLLVK